MQPSKIWFVNEASKGPNLLLVRQLLVHGYAIAATYGRADELTQAGQSAAAETV